MSTKRFLLFSPPSCSFHSRIHLHGRSERHSTLKIRGITFKKLVSGYSYAKKNISRMTWKKYPRLTMIPIWTHGGAPVFAVRRKHDFARLALRAMVSWRAREMRSWVRTFAQSISGWWFGTSILFSHILGISSSQLTFIFFRGVAQPPSR